MNKELSDLAWSVLPKEFKEEVKKHYQHVCKFDNLYSARGAAETLVLLFGKHNLTSDVKEETHLRSLSQETANCDKQFDNILKKGFSKERRLNIVVQLTCAMIPKYQDNGDGHGLSVLNEKDMIKCAYRLADMLIAEAEKGGSK